MTETRPLCPKCMKPFALTEIEGHISECKGVLARRLGCVKVSPRLLDDFLKLPDGCHVRSVKSGYVWGSDISFLLEGAGLPEVEEGVPVPDITIHVTQIAHYETRFDGFWMWDEVKGDTVRVDKPA